MSWSRRTRLLGMVPALLIAAQLSSSCGGSDEESASEPSEPSLIGRCTSAVRELVPCSSPKVYARIVSTDASDEGCIKEGGFAHQPIEGTTYCIGPVEPEARPASQKPSADKPSPSEPPPQIGRCTNFDPDRGFGEGLGEGFDPRVKFVDCDSPKARTRVIEESRRGGEDCEEAYLELGPTLYFCLARLED